MQTPIIISGPGCLSQLKELLQGPAVIISDKGLAEAGVVESVSKQLGVDDCLSYLSGEPTSADVDRAAEHLRDKPCTVIGLGGGSALDLAKLAAAVCEGDAGADAYGECANPLPGRRETILIPTTAGTGSEMSRTAVFTNSDGRKTWAWGEELQANRSVLDPELTLGLPMTPTVYTAVDALSHALEAATAVNKTSLTGHVAEQAVSMIPDALRRVMKDLKNLEAREHLLNASALAGVALNSCGTGLAHALAHALGSLVKIPHGVAIAWSLRVTLESNPDEDYARFPWLRNDPHGTLCRWLDELPIPALPEFSPEELSAALRSPENRVILDNNSRPVTDEDVPGLSEKLRAFC